VGLTILFREKAFMFALLAGDFSPDLVLVFFDQRTVEEGIDGRFDCGSGCSLFGWQEAKADKRVDVLFADGNVEASDSEFFSAECEADSGS
jgi:prepilin-type processing-associated H-X9-DG protein